MNAQCLNGFNDLKSFKNSVLRSQNPKNFRLFVSPTSDSRYFHLWTSRYTSADMVR